jgi:putative ABC transport system substrate-binding protein
MQGVAPVLGVELSLLGVSDAPEIERAIAAFARFPNGGLIVTLGAPTIAHRSLIITLAARHRLPAVYPARYFVAAGGLISYGPDPSTHFGARPAMSTESSRARSRLTCRCRRRPSTKQ